MISSNRVKQVLELRNRNRLKEEINSPFLCSKGKNHSGRDKGFCFSQKTSKSLGDFLFNVTKQLDYELAIFYLNSRVFLSRNYRLIVAPRKFDVLKRNICLRSEASRANMLVLGTSNFQGTTISDRYSSETKTLYGSSLFTTKKINFLPRASSKINQMMKAVKAK